MSSNYTKLQTLELRGKNENIIWRITATEMQRGKYSAVLHLNADGFLWEIAEELKIIAEAVLEQFRGEQDGRENPGTKVRPSKNGIDVDRTHDHGNTHRPY